MNNCARFENMEYTVKMELLHQRLFTPGQFRLISTRDF
jgi:hypothetical protein